MRKNLPEITRQFEESMDEYSARIQKRIDHAISKTYGPLPGRKILPMSRFTVEHVPPIPDPPAVKHVQTLFYNNAIADKSNADAVPVYDPEKDAKTKRLTKYAEKELTISNPERRALRNHSLVRAKGKHCHRRKFTFYLPVCCE